MTTFTVGVGPTKKIVFVANDGVLPLGYSSCGTYVHDEAADVLGNPSDNHVHFHHVQSVLYHRDVANPANVGFWPDNITDFGSISIYKGWDAAPFVLTAPTITGTAQVGQVLTSVLGTWTGAAPTSTRQWKANGVNVASGGTAATYTPVVGDIGKVITCEITAVNAYGTTVAVSGPTAAVIAAA